MTNQDNHLSDYITRECEAWLETIKPICPILSIMGPRQSGKTRLIKHFFPHLPYYDFEKTSTRKLVKKDPEAFVRQNITGAIFDEFQIVPEITEQLKVIADEIIYDVAEYGKGSRDTRFILTGSHNYLMAGGQVESMVGRASILELPPLTASELPETDIYTLMIKGGYPSLYTQVHETPSTFFPRYVNTYIDREVRAVHKIKQFSAFKNFMSICAGRIGQMINYQSLAQEIGLSQSTIMGWLSILEASYIIFFSPPYYNNFEKSLTSKHKLYFYDTGLAASFLKAKSPEALSDPESKIYHLRGKLFENFVVSEVKKKMLNKGLIMDSTYFWHMETLKKKQETPEDLYEIDLLLEDEYALKAIEIKASDTFNPHWFHAGKKLGKLTKVQNFIVYTGPTTQTSDGIALNFKDIERLFVDGPKI